MERAISDARYGYVLIVKTPFEEVEIVTTPKGRKLEARQVRRLPKQAP